MKLNEQGAAQHCVLYYDSLCRVAKRSAILLDLKPRRSSELGMELERNVLLLTHCPFSHNGNAFSSVISDRGDEFPSSIPSMQSSLPSRVARYLSVKDVVLFSPSPWSDALLSMSIKAGTCPTATRLTRTPGFLPPGVFT